MTQFDKAALFAALKPKTVAVAIDGYGDITLKQLSVGEVEAIRAGMKTDGKADAFGLSMVIYSAVDTDGTRIFDESDRVQIEASSNAQIDVLVEAALKLNGFLKKEEQKN